MANIFNVARYILKSMGSVSTWKLQKLCYYSQAWSIAWTETPLFSEDFEAWTNGPVCPQLFHAHQGAFFIALKDLPEQKEDQSSPLTEDQKDTIDKVLEFYGNKEPFELRESTHQEAPWKNARGDCPEGERCNAIITKESMGEYYGSL